MSKKRKLNSKNPKYWDKSKLKEQKVIKETVGKVDIRDSNGNKTGKKAIVKGVWYE